MSKIDSSGEHGRRGDTIYVVLNGKQIKKAPYSPTNPRTPAQQMHRAKLAFINQLSAQLADAVNIGFARVPEVEGGMSPRNAFVKANWKNGALQWNEDKAEWELVPQHLLVADGPRFISNSFMASVEGNILRITGSYTALKENYAVADDQLMVAVFMPEIPKVLVFEGPLRSNCVESALLLPENLPHGTMHIYVWFKATSFHRADGSHAVVRPDQCSRSVYLGTFISDDTAV